MFLNTEGCQNITTIDITHWNDNMITSNIRNLRNQNFFFANFQLCNFQCFVIVSSVIHLPIGYIAIL